MTDELKSSDAMPGMNIKTPANAGFLSRAVDHLNKEVQRGEHDPMPRTMGTPRNPLDGM